MDQKTPLQQRMHSDNYDVSFNIKLPLNVLLVFLALEIL